MHPIAEKVLQGDLRGVARACRLVDDRVEGYIDLLKDLYPRTGKAWVVGVTGTPGAGKSTLTDRLVQLWRSQQKRVGVVAVDPTSPFTGGAILGDRIRMHRHFEDTEVFIRSLATRGALGGISRSAVDVMRVLDAWGAEVIVIETVGVGQDEMEVTRAAHSTLIVVAPGLGDDVQASKAGILECGDVFAVNKADRDGAEAAYRELELMVALGRRVLAASPGSAAATHGPGHTAPALRPERCGLESDGTWVPPIARCVATENQGIEEVEQWLRKHWEWVQGVPQGQERWRQRLREQLEQQMRDALAEVALRDLRGLVEDAITSVAQRKIDPYTACEELVCEFRKG